MEKKKSDSGPSVTVRIIPGKSRRLPLRKGTAVSQILSELGVNPETVVVRISGRIVPESTILSNGDTLEILSIISGG